MGKAQDLSHGLSERVYDLCSSALSVFLTIDNLHKGLPGVAGRMDLNAFFKAAQLSSRVKAYEMVMDHFCVTGETKDLVINLMIERELRPPVVSG